ncbi:MAG: co-chaperone GroES [Caldisericia bacterium]|nr:co-chaperone GroES [Caldisericia bacterium]MDD4615067.1 co-chaperone GroES [Caldisericia bacterium]
MNIRPLGDRVVVKALDAEETTKGGIILPDSAKEKQQKGKVLAVGNGRILDNGTRVPLDIREGDTVLYSKYGGTEVKIDGELYLIVNERDILGVIL